MDLRECVLVARLDNNGDVLLAGPAVRAVAASAERVVLLAGPRGVSAANLLPGVDEVICWRAPWIDPDPEPVSDEAISELVQTIANQHIDAAVILTSFHQSALPLALLLRLAGVRRIAAISEDYPGSLLDVRHRVEEDLPEAERALSIAAAAGYRLPAGDSGRLAIRRPRGRSWPGRPNGPYVVVHPGTSAPARAWPAARWAATVDLLAWHGLRVLVTGAPSEQELTSVVAGSRGIDLGGRTSFTELAGVLADAEVLAAGNTGPAHLAAAVGTPVVSLFAPTVPAVRWAPYGVPCVVLGDQQAACRDSRATRCPIPGHPCLNSVAPLDIVLAVDQLRRDELCAS